MKKASLILFTLMVLFSCQKKEEAVGYELSGNLKNIPDGSILYISENNDIIDSTVVLDEKFELTGSVTNPVSVYLTIKNSSDYKSFWLENSKISFDAEKGKFRQAVISGSKTQQEEKILSQSLDEIATQMEAIENSVDPSMTELEIDSMRREYKRLENREITTTQNFVKEFPSSLVSANVLNIYATTWGKQKTQELFNQFTDENKASDYGLEIQRYLELNKEPQIGEPFVDFELENQNGNQRKLSELKGKVVLLEFWASWCGPCRQENPNLVKTYERFNPQGFEVFAVSLDQDKESWLKAIEKDGLNWEHVSDLKGDRNKAALIYGVSGIPDNFLIAENGEVIGRNLRGEALNEKLEEVLE